MKFLKKLSLKRGQAVVEYALLLMVAALTATAFFALDESLQVKVTNIATSLASELPVLDREVEPDVTGCEEENDCLKLSPPVAKFKVPSPNYKGREIRIVDESYDIDGYVEHYIWSVNGVIMKKSREDIAADGGLVVKFRESGTYNVNLLVVDNDGLISALESKTLTVINRNPVLTLNVENEKGALGSSVDVFQGCTATFYTHYTDPDLPYDVLTLYSQFTDQSGVVSSDNTAPNQFKRDFPNLGRNTYLVTVTDEDKASVTATVTVNVIPNPNGIGVCADALANPVKPKYSIEVERSDGQPVRKEGNVYYFPANSYAIVKPVVEWGSYPAHQIPYYWSATQGNIKGWYTSMDGSRLTFPYPAPPNMFLLTTKDITVTGMARDTSAISNTADPNLRGMSNTDTVILRVEKTAYAGPRPIISLFESKTKQYPSIEKEVREVDITDAPGLSYKAQIESVMSDDPQGKKIIGYRWLMSDGKTWRPLDGENGAEVIVDNNGNSKWWYTKPLNSPDTLDGKKTFTWVKDKPNTWTYQLEVINEDKIASATPAKKTIKLTYNPNKPPVAACSPDPAKIFKGKGSIALSAKGSSDPDKGDTIEARWSKDGKSWTGWQNISENIPSNWTFNSDTTVKLEVRDNKLAVSKKDCTIKVKEIAPDGFAFNLDFWYIEDRVQKAPSTIHLSNRTDPLSYIGVTKWRIESVYGESNGDVYNPTPYYSDHRQQQNYGVNGEAGTYIVTLHVSDNNDGFPTDCGGFPYEEMDVGGKTYGFCKKGSHFFKMDKFTRPKVSGGSGGSGTCTYYSVAADLTAHSQYESKWKKGATDKVAGVADVKQDITDMLKCQ